jgi:hypothetical protein
LRGQRNGRTSEMVPEPPDQAEAATALSLCVFVVLVLVLAGIGAVLLLM